MCGHGWYYGGGFANCSANTLRLRRNQSGGPSRLRGGGNHRLNILGFMYLAELGGEQHRPVRRRPSNQAAGASQHALGDAGARGLFHRAMVMSGAAIRLNERKRGAKLAESALSEVGLRSGAGRRGGGERIGGPTPPPTGQHLFSITNAGATTTTAVRRGCCGRRSPALEDAGRTAGYSLNLDSAEAVRAWLFARRGSAGCLIHFHGQFQKAGLGRFPEKPRTQLNITQESAETMMDLCAGKFLPQS
jgi:hypothetical protein